MLWHYVIVFLGTLVADAVPLPMPPAFTVMVLLQTTLKLNIWLVIAVGVPGSVVGRYLLALAVPRLSERVLRPELSEDVRFLGRKLQEKGWRVPAFVFLYSLTPLPTAPIFIAGGMARIRAVLLLPPFVAGKLISDALAVLIGAHAVGTLGDVVHGLTSWRTLTGVAVGALLLFALVFVDWRSVVQDRAFALRSSIWSSGRTEAKAPDGPRPAQPLRKEDPWSRDGPGRGSETRTPRESNSP